MKNKYLVTVVRTGSVSIEADDEDQALDIANSLKTDSVCWSDDWEATDVVELDCPEEFPSVLLNPFKRGICDKCEYQHFVNPDYSGGIAYFCWAYDLPCSSKGKCEMYERKRF